MMLSIETKKRHQYDRVVVLHLNEGTTKFTHTHRDEAGLQASYTMTSIVLVATHDFLDILS